MMGTTRATKLCNNPGCKAKAAKGRGICWRCHREKYPPNPEKLTRMNFSMSPEFAAEFRQAVPQSKRSEFVREAVARAMEEAKVAPWEDS